MKRSASVRMVLWTGITILLIAALLLGIGGVSLPNLGSLFKLGSFSLSSYAYENAEDYTAGGASIAGSGIRKIDINWVSGSVDIQVYDGDTIQFSEASGSVLDEDQTLYYRVKNDKLTIQYAKAKSGISFGRNPSKALTLMLPATLSLASLDVEGVSNSVTMSGEGISIGQLDIETVSGSVLVEDVIANELDLQSVSGSTNLKGSFGIIDAEGVSGSQTYRLHTVPDAMDVDLVSGSVNVYMTKTRGFTASLDSVSGSLNTDFAEKLGRKNAVYGDGSARMDFETVSGSVNIQYDASLEAPVKQPVKPEKAKPTGTPEPTKTTGEPIPSSKRSF